MNALESQEIVTSVVHAISHSRHFLKHKLLYIYLVNFNNYPASLRISYVKSFCPYFFIFVKCTSKNLQ